MQEVIEVLPDRAVQYYYKGCSDDYIYPFTSKDGAASAKELLLTPLMK
jgi:hypothetical protein